MTDKSELLTRYNDLRAKQGLPKFAVWTNSVESLEDAYNKLNGGGGDDKPKAAKKASVKPTKNVASKEHATGKKEGVPLRDICKKINVEPRAARIKLRKAKNVPKTVSDNWTFAAKDVAAVEKIIK